MPTSTIRESDVDVLIIGAGPAGLMAANALARNGVKVRIIDQRLVASTLFWCSAPLNSCFKDQLRFPQDKRMVFNQEQLRFSRLVYEYYQVNWLDVDDNRVTAWQNDY